MTLGNVVVFCWQVGGQVAQKQKIILLPLHWWYSDFLAAQDLAKHDLVLTLTFFLKQEDKKVIGL